MTAARRIAALAIVLITASAAAQGVHHDDVGAEALFREGKRLMKDGKLAEACDKFEASDRLDSSVGTLLNLADCREKNGQLATGWATFLRAATAARANGDFPRESEARNRAHAIEPRLSYLTISVPEASRVDGLIVERDGAVVDHALWNQGVPIDAGSYEISGRAPGHEPWSAKVKIAGEQQHASVEVPRFKQLEDLTPAAAPKQATPPPVAARAADEDDERDEPAARPHTFTRMRYVSIGVAALGVVGLAGGIGYGLEGKSLQRQSDAICPTTTCGDAHARDLNANAQTDVRNGEILIGVGGALVVGAAVLWFVGAPPAAGHVALAPAIGRDHVGLALGGAF